MSGALRDSNYTEAYAELCLAEVRKFDLHPEAFEYYLRHVGVVNIRTETDYRRGVICVSCLVPSNSFAGRGDCYKIAIPTKPTVGYSDDKTTSTSMFIVTLVRGYSKRELLRHDPYGTISTREIVKESRDIAQLEKLLDVSKETVIPMNLLILL
jgi:hypothetical protein